MIDKSTWKKVRLGDVVHQLKDNVDAATCGLEYYLGGEHFNTDDLHTNGKGVIFGSTIGPAFTMRFKPGHVLIVSRNPYLRKMAVADFEGVCSNVTYICETKSNDLLQEFLPFIIRSSDFWQFAEANKRGSTNFYLNWSDFAQYEFLLPPIEEQKHIAEILWAADDVVQKHTAVRNNIRTVKMLLLDGLCETLSVDNNVIQLGDVIEYKSGQVDPKGEPYKSMPLIAPNHIEGGTGKIIKIESAEQQNAISGKYLFEAGDVVYSKIRPSLNKVFMASFEGLCSADMYPLKVKSQKITSNFLYYLLTSNKFVEYATVCSVRTSIPKLNRTDMSKFEFCCPNKKQQDLFLKKMHSCEDSLDQINQQIANSQEVLFALIDNYLGGAN